jgi:uncharacterized protein
VNTAIKILIENDPFLNALFTEQQQQEMVDPAHDFQHILRVLANAGQIAEKEGGNLRLILIATLLHDHCNLPKSDPNSHLSSQYSADHAKRRMEEAGFSQEHIAIVYDAILCHSFSLGKTPTTLEGKILQDADRLDGLGAIGIARCFATAGLRNAPFYSTDDPFCERGRAPDDKKNAVDHFYKKLFKLKDLMQTPTGKMLAAAREETMRHYLSSLKSEI